MSAGKPWIVNQLPKGGEENVKLLRPVRFGVRDAETFVNPDLLLVEVGYAKVHSEADALFDALPRTKRVSLLSGIIAVEPTVVLNSEGVAITRNTGDAQRSVYTTVIDSGIGHPSAMVSAVLRPDVSSGSTGGGSGGPLNYSVLPGPLLPLPFSVAGGGGSSGGIFGTILGMEYGPRNTGAYLWFYQEGSTKKIRLTGPMIEDGTMSPDISMIYDWSTFNRYTIVWNELHGYVEVYADLAGVTTQIFRVPISSFEEFSDELPVRFGGAGNVVAVYGQEGADGNKSTWKNIAVTTDVGYPIVGNVRPGFFKTATQSADLVRTNGLRDPRDADIGAWFNAPDTHFQELDGVATAKVVAGVFQMTKPTLGKTFALYRDEPGFLRSSTEGLVLQAAVVAENTRQDSASSGMGITIYDGQSIFQLTLFNDFATKTIGLRKKTGDDIDITEQYLPTAPFDWGSGKPFRFIVDPRKNTVQLWDVANLSEPILEIPLDRDLFPSGSDKGWASLTPFIAFGHTTEAQSSGTFKLKSLEYGHLYQAWEGRNGLLPQAGGTNPAFTLTTTGAPTPTTVMASDLMTLTSAPGTTAKIHRTAPFSANRGAILEARMKISSWRARHRTGTYLVLDDGLRSYALTFVENAVGKFVALSKRDNAGGFEELVGRDGPATKLSFVLDWSEFHVYRLERRPYDGLYVYIDGETTHRLFYPEVDMASLPLIQFSGTPSIAFGQFSGEGATSQWDFVRGFFSGGYEISLKKNKPDAVLREELFGTQAIVIAYVQDV